MDLLTDVVVVVVTGVGEDGDIVVLSVHTRSDVGSLGALNLSDQAAGIQVLLDNDLSLALIGSLLTIGQDGTDVDTGLDLGIGGVAAWKMASRTFSLPRMPLLVSDR